MIERTEQGRNVPAHQPTIELGQPIPADVDAGTSIPLKVRISCQTGCDLRGHSVQVIGPDGIVETSALTTYANKSNETDEFLLRAPGALGEYAWTIRVERHEAEHAIHEECRLPISFKTRPHPTSMAVWDVPSPVAMRHSFKLKVGVKCAIGCQLTGHHFEVCNEAGTTIGRGTLGDTPWPGTESLYWGEVHLVAPLVETISSWTVTFGGTRSDLPHDPTSTSFGFRSTKPPEHNVTVTVVAKDTAVPVNGVEVRLGPYECYTHGDGVAVFEVPKGTYAVSIGKDGFAAEPLTLDVSEDVSVALAASAAPTKAEIEERMMQFDDYPWG